MLAAGLRSFTFPEEALREVRRDIYHSTGPGYHLFRGFLDPVQAGHVRRFWTREANLKGDFALYRNQDSFTIGQGPWSSHFKGKDCYFFALWNAPPDEVTHAAAVAVTQLRNQVEQQPIYRDLVPGGRFMTAYMVVISHEAEEIEVKWHRDTFDEGRNQGAEVETRLQATLFLSEYGRDYSGDGLLFEDNQGRTLRLGETLHSRCGDLLLWRYSNRHAVGPVAPLPGGIGFVRVLFPLFPVSMPRTPAAVATPAPAAIEIEPRVGQAAAAALTVRQRLGRIARRAGIYEPLKRMGF